MELFNPPKSSFDLFESRDHSTSVAKIARLKIMATYTAMKEEAYPCVTPGSLGWEKSGLKLLEYSK